MAERKPRKDAVRNRAALLAAADDLFAHCENPDDITMADVAAGAGVGKASLFRAFGDRTGLIRALHAARLEPVERAVAEESAPLGSATPPLERTPALLDALPTFKIDNRHLALALESTTDDSPCRMDHYDRWHGLLRGVLEQIPGLGDGDFTAHAPLAAVRADLVEHLAGDKGMDKEELRARLAAYTAQVIDPGRVRPA